MPEPAGWEPCQTKLCRTLRIWSKRAGVPAATAPVRTVVALEFYGSAEGLFLGRGADVLIRSTAGCPRGSWRREPVPLSGVERHLILLSRARPYRLRTVDLTAQLPGLAAGDHDPGYEPLLGVARPTDSGGDAAFVRLWDERKMMGRPHGRPTDVAVPGHSSHDTASVYVVASDDQVTARFAGVGGAVAATGKEVPWE